MSHEILVLAGTAAVIGFTHTLFGPDHYLPFIVMSRAGKWSLLKTTVISFLCGIGHILSSVVLGMIGVAMGIVVTQLTDIESFRGSIAAWLLISFGFLYCIWGIRRAIKNKPHSHLHLHGNGSAHDHTHTHQEEHTHVHQEESKQSLTPWILFTIFVFGPCEPLIPILMYPAAQESISGLIFVTAVFGGVTILTMITIIIAASFGISFLPMGKLERYSHALAGAVICLSGMAIQFLGL